MQLSALGQVTTHYKLQIYTPHYCCSTLTVADLKSRAAKVMNLSAGAGNTVVDNNLEEKIIIPASSAGRSEAELI